MGTKPEPSGPGPHMNSKHPFPPVLWDEPTGTSLGQTLQVIVASERELLPTVSAAAQHGQDDLETPG